MHQLHPGFFHDVPQQEKIHIHVLGNQENQGIPLVSKNLFIVSGNVNGWFHFWLVKSVYLTVVLNFPNKISEKTFTLSNG